MSRHSFGRGTTEGTRKISIFQLKKTGHINSDDSKGYYHGRLYWSKNDEPCGEIQFEIDTDEDTGAYVRLIYSISKPYEPTENRRSMDYKFDLVSRPCRYGGKRWYFRCGLYKDSIYCGRKVAILYQIGDYFGCRHCANLSYSSCNQNKKYKKGIFRMLFGTYDDEKEYSKLKRFYYRDKPTRKYRRYLKMTYYSDAEVKQIQDELDRISPSKNK